MHDSLVGVNKAYLEPADAIGIQSAPRAPASQLPSRLGADINLASVDLNLLVALESLLRHCNVTHAAAAVGLSQPAMSRALSRLRGMFNDDLLVRTSAGYVRTVRGEYLYDRLPAMLDSVRNLVATRSAGHKPLRSMLRLAMPDHQALVLMRHVMDRLQAPDAKSVDVVIEPLGANLLKRLENGELEMAIGQVSGRSNGFFQRTLYKDEYACLVREDHPVLEEAWSSIHFHELRHAVTAPGHDEERSFLADIVTDGSPVDCRVVSPNTLGTAMAVVDSDMILTVPKRVAAKLADLLSLAMIDLPIEAAPYEVVLLWHERNHRDTEHGYVRAEFASAAQKSGSEEWPLIMTEQ
jgi:DNA-binding transcriptional LysR family regulator